MYIQNVRCYTRLMTKHSTKPQCSLDNKYLRIQQRNLRTEITFPMKDPSNMTLCNNVASPEIKLHTQYLRNFVYACSVECAGSTISYKKKNMGGTKQHLYNKYLRMQQRNARTEITGPTKDPSNTCKEPDYQDSKQQCFKSWN